MNKNLKHNNTETKSGKRIGKIEIINPIAQLVFEDNAYVEIIAQGFKYADSPIWIKAENLLLFTDLPNKRIHYWKEHYKEPKTYLEDIDFIGQNTKNGELNSSALLFSNVGEITLMLYGEDKIAKMNAIIREPKFNFDTWISNPQKYQLITPSHFTEDKLGNIYFTDTIATDNNPKASKKPLYGLYRISNKNKLELLLENHLSPEGIALSPENKALYITYSDKKKDYLYRYELNKGKPNEDTFKVFDYTPFISDIDDKPRGLKTDKFGNIYTAGPNGLWVFNKDMELIARVHFTEIATDCVFSEDYKTLYITASDKVLKLKLRD
ncbi:SMP-30/gluconolactonase/LRE family protein [Myroides marinus]|uniref:SMP-30/gluconolactonase/LRE family protein n=1 Tax=Myroides marinus TaxID=703342 RepID=UPI002576410E|nr:SMP-30/gluconolactonase/LRE family protein [Myroides marinus]MDM1355939.1 SMP-30/gluconolactonase/LRE family protein [Myroides marinus]MDM1383797.1 SMP-30/gluconolactonase/LRE family protein [Myroides marinus]MDM1405774.1 SMP-30/gluconolactonase/LRE family protein [Myroides marinus]MDM1533590.1 SMP-30/gluconolactonase/LRE family protein [Myroides marinus]MDM1540553.1 SMP-30/gluconolactonase/LRE family protein [Myroides marinus]